jgi:hypothetical protein
VKNRIGGEGQAHWGMPFWRLHDAAFLEKHLAAELAAHHASRVSHRSCFHRKFGPKRLTYLRAGVRPDRTPIYLGNPLPKLCLGISIGVNGMDNFRSVSASIFNDMVCNYSNPTDMDADIDIVHADILRI